MKFFKYLFVLLSLILIVSCGGDEEEEDWGNDGDGNNNGNNEGNGGWISQEDTPGKVLKTRGFNNINALAVGLEDILYIGGTTLDTLYSDELTEITKADALLVAFDAKGKELWGKQWNVVAGSSDNIRHIVTDGHNIYVSGGSHITFVMKFAPDGTKIWEQFPSESYTIASLALDNKQNVYSSNDNEITKYSSDGKILQNYKVFDDSTITVLAVDSEENIYVVGQTSDSLFAENAGKSDVFLMKLAPDGTQLWGKQWGSNETDYIYSPVIDDENNIYVCWYTSKKGPGGGVKFATDGKIIWEQEKVCTSMIINNNEIYAINKLVEQGVIDKYNSDGKYIGSSRTYEKDSFRKIIGGSKGNIYVLTSKDAIIRIPSSDIK